jgi:hypothetical protein
MLVVGTEQIKRRFVLFDQRKASDGMQKAIVGGIIVDRRNLASQHPTALCPECVVQERRECDTFARVQHDDATGSDRATHAISTHLDHAGLIEALIRRRVVELHHQCAAAAIDDIFGFLPVEMQRRDLSIFDDQYLFGIRFASRVAGVAVAQGEQGQTGADEIPRTEIGDIPAESIGNDFGAL